MAQRSRAALLDTNLLLLWLAGTTDLSLFKTFKRVQPFTVTDYLLLTDVLPTFKHLTTTPHVLAETSNFLDQAPPYRRDALVVSFREHIDLAEELVVPAKQLALRSEFASLGLTDSGLVAVASEVTVFTADFRLRGIILANNGRCVHLQELRNPNAP